MEGSFHPDGTDTQHNFGESDLWILPQTIIMKVIKKSVERAIDPNPCIDRRHLIENIPQDITVHLRLKI